MGSKGAMDVDDVDAGAAVVVMFDVVLPELQATPASDISISKERERRTAPA